MVSKKRGPVRRALYRWLLRIFPQTVFEVVPAQHLRTRALIRVAMARQAAR